MNKSFDDALLSDDDIRQLEFECKVEFASNFNELYLQPLKDAIEKLPEKKSLTAIKHIGHKVSGHAEFPELIPLGESLEQLALEMMENNQTDASILKILYTEICKVYDTDIQTFIKQYKK